jgi:MOSC domain-containing protein YiiM
MGAVTAVARRPTHFVSKQAEARIRLLAGLGVEGDAHAGRTVKHRSRVRHDPGQPNLRQVHLIHSELHEELREAGYDVEPGQMGENVTTRGIDLLALPAGTVLRLGESAAIEVTGLRNPCKQLEQIQPGLMKATLDEDEDGNVIRKAGIMAVVLQDGEITPGDAIYVDLPPKPHRSLRPV